VTGSALASASAVICADQFPRSANPSDQREFPPACFSTFARIDIEEKFALDIILARHDFADRGEILESDDNTKIPAYGFIGMQVCADDCNNSKHSPERLSSSRLADLIFLEYFPPLFLIAIL